MVMSALQGSGRCGESAALLFKDEIVPVRGGYYHSPCVLVTCDL